MSHDSAERKSSASAIRFPACLKYDLLAGFLVFLIALPLCLAIARASGYPPIAGVITAIVGGVVASLISNSELTIKGPAAGLIAIVIACVGDLSQFDVAGTQFPGYRLALAVGVMAAFFQIAFGLLKAGKLADFFPTAAVHGLLASIGVIIMIRSFLSVLGVTDKTPIEASELVLEYPHFIQRYDLPIAIIGFTALAIMVFYPMIKLKACKAFPAQLVVLMVTIPLAMFLNLHQPTAAELAAAPPVAAAGATSADVDHSKHAGATLPPIDPNHSIMLAGSVWQLPPDKLLINVPNDFTQAFTTPEFSGLFGAKSWFVAWKWVLMFAIIASLESLLSAKAVDVLDPYKRKTDQNRDLVGCGVANLISSFIGGLPMISEIVRSRANVDAGAKTRLSNLSHGVFLLLFAAGLPFVLKMIPVAALAAMLLYTGFRLAHPREFVHMYKVGVEQFVVFCTTIIAIVCTDLLIGVVIGMVTELVINLFRGLSIRNIFSPTLSTTAGETYDTITVQDSVVFSNWLPLRSAIESLGLQAKKSLIVDLSSTQLVDHTVMEKLEELEREFHNENLELKVIGLEQHRATSAYPTAARLRIAQA